MLNVRVINTTIEYEGIPVKISDGRVFMRAFGTTIYNHSPHWSWMEVEVEGLKPGLRDYLTKQGLI